MNEIINEILSKFAQQVVQKFISLISTRVQQLLCTVKWIIWCVRTVAKRFSAILRCLFVFFFT